MTVKVHLGFLPVVLPVPCVHGFGSCRKSVREFLDKNAPKITEALGDGVTDLSLQDFLKEYCMPDLSFLGEFASSLISGKVDIQLEIKDKFRKTTFNFNFSEDESH